MLILYFCTSFTFFFLSDRLSVWSLCLVVYLSACEFACFYVCLFVCFSVCLFVCLFACLCACLSVCLLVCLPAFVFVCLSICLRKINLERRDKELSNIMQMVCCYIKLKERRLKQYCFQLSSKRNT